MHGVCVCVFTLWSKSDKCVEFWHIFLFPFSKHTHEVCFCGNNSMLKSLSSITKRDPNLIATKVQIKSGNDHPKKKKMLRCLLFSFKVTTKET